MQTNTADVKTTETDRDTRLARRIVMHFWSLTVVVSAYGLLSGGFAAWMVPVIIVALTVLIPKLLESVMHIVLDERESGKKQK